MAPIAMQRLASTRPCTIIAPRHTRTYVPRTSVVSKATETPTEPATSPTSTSSSKLSYPEWVPAEAAPFLNFFAADDFSIYDTDVYNKYIKQYVETDVFDMSTGFKPIPETINGRAAMLGFLAAAGAEIAGSGTFMAQLGKAPLPIVVILGLVTAASIVPIVKGTKGDYLDSLKDTYTLPEGVFTEVQEKFHGRLAMVGLAGLIFIELIKGAPLL